MSIDFDAYMFEYAIGDEISISTSVDGAVNAVSPVADENAAFLWEEDFENLLFGSGNTPIPIPPVLNPAGDLLEFDDWEVLSGSFTGVVRGIPVGAGVMVEVSMFAKFWRPGDDMNEVIIGSPEEIRDYVYYEASVYSGVAPLFVTLTNYSYGAYNSYKWYINGSLFSTSKDTTLLIRKPGVYIITLYGFKKDTSDSYSEQFVIYATKINTHKTNRSYTLGIMLDEEETEEDTEEQTDELILDTDRFFNYANDEQGV